MTDEAEGPAIPRAAAAVVLARDGEGLEVLLLERHPGSRMAPGAFAFPGGRVEPADAWADAERFCRGLTLTAAAGALRDVRPAARAIAFWIAALRELFEETGILLAHAPPGTRAVGPRRLAARRARCRRDPGAFRALLAASGLTLATDRMAYCAHWITPEERPVRFDARFFVTAALTDTVPDPDGIEVVGWRWIGPAAALARHAAGELALPLPTREILRSVAGHGDVTTLLAGARGREIHPIRPRVVLDEGCERILMPGDPGYF